MTGKPSPRNERSWKKNERIDKLWKCQFGVHISVLIFIIIWNSLFVHLFVIIKLWYFLIKQHKIFILITIFTTFAQVYITETIYTLCTHISICCYCFLLLYVVSLVWDVFTVRFLWYMYSNTDKWYQFIIYIIFNCIRTLFTDWVFNFFESSLSCDIRRRTFIKFHFPKLLPTF